MNRTAVILIGAVCVPGVLLAQARRPTRAAAAAPAPRAPAFSWSAVAAGSGYTCGLDNTGQAYCWGENLNHKLGITDSINIRRPEKVETPQRFTAITAGTYDTCALTREGSPVCWGGRAPGSLPHAALGQLRLLQLDYGTGACAVAADSTAWCWGPNGSGQLGSGRATPGAGSAPERVAGNRRWRQVVVGDSHACGLTVLGAAFCWGGAVALGSGARAGSNVPVPVSGGIVFTQLAAGAEHTCGLAADGAAWCWGDNTTGALGGGAAGGGSVPIAVAGNHYWRALSAGNAFSCGITVQAKTYCWGSGQRGALGNGGVRNALVPVIIPAAPGTLVFTSISSGSEHSCAITTRGALYCWGDNADGELGIAHSSTCRAASGPADARPCAPAPARVQEPR